MKKTIKKGKNQDLGNVNDAARILGRLGGMTITPAKSEAARQNGKLGGRPPGK
jgi:hypothetical protein